MTTSPRTPKQIKRRIIRDAILVAGFTIFAAAGYPDSFGRPVAIPWWIYAILGADSLGNILYTAWLFPNLYDKPAASTNTFVNCRLNAPPATPGDTPT